MGDRVVPLLSK
jgi:adenylate cyclase